MRWHVAGQQEWFLVLALSLGAVFLLLSVYWLSYRTTGPQTAFTGLLMNAEDGQCYVAQMLQGFDIHRAETVDVATKQAVISRFLDAQIGSGWRQRLLADYAVGYIWFGPREKALGTFDPGSVRYLVPIYDGNGITLFAVSTDREKTGNDLSPASERCACENYGVKPEVVTANIGEGGR